MPQTVWIPFHQLENFMADAFQAIGVPEADAKICADVLITSDKRGIGEETGGYKGYGFATVVELLSAALQQGNFLSALSGIGEDGKPQPYGLGHFFIAINIEHFCDLAAFKKTAGDILRELRNSEKAPGAERIYTCGEKEHLAWLDRKEKGAPIDDTLQKQLIQIRDEQNLTQYKFPFEA